MERILRAVLARNSQRVREIAAAIAGAGGRALLVGGCVRDALLGREPKDLDLEVYGLSVERLRDLLASFGEVIEVGRAFGVLRVKGLDLDVSLPRRDSKVATGHKGFAVRLDPGLDFAEAARWRVLTMNSIGLDVASGELLDPYGGRRDMERRVLRATDAQRFPEDPLRGLRVAQFAARFEMRPDEELMELLRQEGLADRPELAGTYAFASADTPLAVAGG